MKTVSSSFIQRISKLDGNQLIAEIDELEIQLKDKKARSTMLVRECKRLQDSMDMDKAEDRIATEKANRNMRSHYKTEVAPLLEKLAHAHALYQTKYVDRKTNG